MFTSTKGNSLWARLQFTFSTTIKNPFEGRKCTAISLVSSNTNSTEYTDDGIAEFDRVPTGEVEVFVNGEKQLSISVGQNDREDVTVTI